MSTSQQPLFGRAWSLSITTASKVITVSCSAWEPESLRIRFEVSLAAHVDRWYARIEIYNATSELMQEVLTQGQSVVLSAGYQNPGAQTIFEGQIYQPMWERENGVDFKLTLMCYTGLKESINNLASLSGTPGQTQAALIAQMCANAHTPITVGGIDTTAIADTRLPRARAFFGDPRVFINDVAKRNGIQTWTGFDGLWIKSYQVDDSTPTITYGPENGLLGTPQQTQDGVEFDVLLDPRLVITASPNQVKLNQSAIRQRPRVLGEYPSILDQDNTYIVMGVDFVGDSRGNDWYAHVVAVTSVGGKLALYTDAATSSTNDAAVQLDPQSAR